MVYEENSIFNFPLVCFNNFILNHKFFFSSVNSEEDNGLLQFIEDNKSVIVVYDYSTNLFLRKYFDEYELPKNLISAISVNQYIYFAIFSDIAKRYLNLDLKFPQVLSFTKYNYVLLNLIKNSCRKRLKEYDSFLLWNCFLLIGSSVKYQNWFYFVYHKGRIGIGLPLKLPEIRKIHPYKYYEVLKQTILGSDEEEIIFNPKVKFFVK